MGNNPSHFSRTGRGKKKVKSISDADLRQFPVECVSWEDIVNQFLVKLNEKERTSGWLYRLPAEAEWEYSCRGGLTSKEECSFHFYFDKPSNDLSSEQANFNGNYPDGSAGKGPDLERTTKVGSYRPNRLGLYDMHRNVWEWCSDLFEGGSYRVIRGGSKFLSGSHCRAAYRNGSAPTDWNDSLGFRLARVPRPVAS
jgi:formylglycine-generating enzyme required for sulfatase activity